VIALLVQYGLIGATPVLQSQAAADIVAKPVVGIAAVA
jgi:hypothetical protein